nr:hypothetical protein [Victivallis lenta]
MIPEEEHSFDQTTVPRPLHPRLKKTGFEFLPPHAESTPEPVRKSEAQIARSCGESTVHISFPEQEKKDLRVWPGNIGLRSGWLFLRNESDRCSERADTLCGGNPRPMSVFCNTAYSGAASSPSPPKIAASVKCRGVLSGNNVSARCCNNTSDSDLKKVSEGNRIST